MNKIFRKLLLLLVTVVLIIACTNNKDKRQLNVKDCSGSILKINFNNYVDHQEYVTVNAKIYLSEYYSCNEDFVKEGNIFKTNNNNEYKIVGISLNSDNEKVLNLKRINSDNQYYGWTYYNGVTNRIEIFPDIKTSTSNDIMVDIYINAPIESYEIDQRFINDCLNDNFDYYFYIVGDEFDNKNIMRKIYEYEINEGD